MTLEVTCLLSVIVAARGPLATEMPSIDRVELLLSAATAAGPSSGLRSRSPSLL
jgi:hypothetical protein